MCVCVCVGGGGGGGGCPAPSIVVPASVCFFYCKILCNVAKFSPISPSSHPLGYPISCSLFPCPLQTARPYYSRVPTSLSLLSFVTNFVTSRKLFTVTFCYQQQAWMGLKHKNGQNLCWFVPAAKIHLISSS